MWGEPNMSRDQKRNRWGVTCSHQPSTTPSRKWQSQMKRNRLANREPYELATQTLYCQIHSQTRAGTQALVPWDRSSPYEQKGVTVVVAGSVRPEGGKSWNQLSSWHERIGLTEELERGFPLFLPPPAHIKALELGRWEFLWACMQWNISNFHFQADVNRMVR